MITQSRRDSCLAKTLSVGLLSAVLGTVGCNREIKDSYTTPEGGESPAEQVDRLPARPALRPEFQPFVVSLRKLDDAFVKLANDLQRPVGNNTELVLNNEQTLKDARQAITETETSLLKLLQTPAGREERIVLSDYAEQLGEARGALFKATKTRELPSYIYFPGDGINEIHGTIAKTRALEQIYTK